MLKTIFACLVTSVTLAGCATPYYGDRYSQRGGPDPYEEPLTPDAALIPYMWSDGIFRDSNGEVSKTKTCQYYWGHEEWAYFCNAATVEDARQSSRDTWNRTEPLRDDLRDKWEETRPERQKRWEELKKRVEEARKSWSQR